jgi:hypothetical protein
MKVLYASFEKFYSIQGNVGAEVVKLSHNSRMKHLGTKTPRHIEFECRAIINALVHWPLFIDLSRHIGDHP